MSQKHALCRLVRPDVLLASGRLSLFSETFSFIFAVLCHVFVVSVLSNSNDELSLFCCVLEDLDHC